MEYYSIEYVSDGTDKGLIKGERFGDDGLTWEEAKSAIIGYLSYNGRVRVWKGMRLVITYESSNKRHYK